MQDGTVDGEHGGGGKKVGGGVGGDVEVDFSSSAFEALERDFQEVLSELVGDKSLERFRCSNRGVISLDGVNSTMIAVDEMLAVR